MARGTVVIRRVVFRLLALFVVAIAGTSLARARDIPIEGGAGGGAFRDECPAGQYLIGVQARTGASIDQIAIRCGTVKPDGTVSNIRQDPDARGGSGGSPPTRRDCGSREIITSMGLLMGRQPPHDVVRLIIFNCVSTTTTARHNLDIGAAPLFPTINQTCRDGEAATGLQGRSGSYVDALGLICGPFAKAGADPGPGTGPGTGPGAGASGGCAGLAGDELAICNQHNALRARHGVPALTWSKDLAKNAKDWVAGCHTKKNNNGDEFFCHQSPNACGSDPNYKFGENLSWFWGTPQLTPEQVVNGWYCENNVYDYDNPQPGGTIQFGCDNNPDKVTGHFTQVVWKSTQRLGCAKNTCPLAGNSDTLWACEYDPAGNITGQFKQNVPKPIQGFAATRSLRFPPSQSTTAIISDVDLYDVPGGVGRVIGILRRGQKFPLIQCRQDDWCQLSEGWVWGSFIVRSHSLPIAEMSR